MEIPVTVACSGLLGAMMVLLSARVSAMRMRSKVSLGEAGDKALYRAVRLHANAVEHIVLFLVLCLVYELTAGTDMLLIPTAVAFVGARLLYTQGMWSRSFSLQRQLGAGVTNLAQLALSVALSVALLFHFVRKI